MSHIYSYSITGILRLFHVVYSTYIIILFTSTYTIYCIYLCRVVQGIVDTQHSFDALIIINEAAEAHTNRSD